MADILKTRQLTPKLSLKEFITRDDQAQSICSIVFHPVINLLSFNLINNEKSMYILPESLKKEMLGKRRERNKPLCLAKLCQWKWYSIWENKSHIEICFFIFIDYYNFTDPCGSFLVMKWMLTNIMLLESTTAGDLKEFIISKHIKIEIMLW